MISRAAETSPCTGSRDNTAINGVAGFHGPNAEEIVAAFREAADDYLETCALIGKAPGLGYSGKLTIRTDPAVHARPLGRHHRGVSLNEFAENALEACAEETVRRKAPALG